VKDIDGVFTPAWSPNGQMIAFVRRYGNDANLVGRIWVARADAPALLTPRFAASKRYFDR
jgi:hypothetical protein